MAQKSQGLSCWICWGFTNFCGFLGFFVLIRRIFSRFAFVFMPWFRTVPISISADRNITTIWANGAKFNFLDSAARHVGNLIRVLYAIGITETLHARKSPGVWCDEHTHFFIAFLLVDLGREFNAV